MRQSGAHENLVVRQVGQAGSHQTNHRPDKESDVLELGRRQRVVQTHVLLVYDSTSLIGDPFESRSLNLYTDADHASETEHQNERDGSGPPRAKLILPIDMGKPQTNCIVKQKLSLWTPAYSVKRCLFKSCAKYLLISRLI